MNTGRSFRLVIGFSDAGELWIRFGLSECTDPHSKLAIISFFGVMDAWRRNGEV